MYFRKRYLFFLFFFFPVNDLKAQDITGTWEGDLGTYQFLQLNIIQNGDRICGFTWDYIKKDQRDHCKAYFQGHYDKKNDQWIIEGTDFIENSGSHTLMRLNLRHRANRRKDFLDGVSIGEPSVFDFFFKFEDSPFFFRNNNNDTVFLQKVSDKPSEVLEKMMDCYLKKTRSFDTTGKSRPPVTITDSIAKANTNLIPVNDSTVKPLPQAVTAKDSISIPAELVKRKNNEQNRVEVNVKKITLNVYDNAIVDGDTVSIFYNGKLLLSHQRLSETPIVIELELDEKQSRQEIILFAENLGSIPPNTALVVVYAGDKRYELYASASLQENAVLVFDYRPK